MKLISEFRNDLMKRNEIETKLDSLTNPGFQKCNVEIAKLLSVEGERIVIRKINGNFGSHSFTVEAFVYDSAKDKDSNEPRKKMKKTEGAK